MKGEEAWRIIFRADAIKRGRTKGDRRCDGCPNLGYCHTVPWLCDWNKDKKQYFTQKMVSKRKPHKLLKRYC